MKRFFVFILCGLLYAANNNAQTWQIGSQNAADVIATLDDGVLTIRGTGRMMNFYGSFWIDNIILVTSAPWSTHRNSLTAVVIENGVTTIGISAFSGCTGIKEVTIGSSVTSINQQAFRDCTGLTSLIIPNSVTKIELYAFQGCTGLTSITIPNSVTSIDMGTFTDCIGLTSVNIPNSVTSIEYQAFFGCKALTSVNIPNSVTLIGLQVFMGCSGLTSIDVDIDNSTYISEDGVLFNKTKTQLIYYPGGKKGNYTIPNSVTSIEMYAFYGCIGIATLTIPNSVRVIGERAFSDCTSLTSVTIPNSVTSIGIYALSGCTSLLSVTIPISISEGMFSYCTGLTSVIIGNSATSIGRYAFMGCTVLTSITFGNSVSSIGIGAFIFCSGLTSLTIPNSVISIGESAFNGCTGLTSLIIPNSVSIGRYAFMDCTGLEEIINYATTPQYVDNAFANLILDNVTLYVPCGSVTSYKNADTWWAFGKILEIEAVITFEPNNGGSPFVDNADCNETVAAPEIPLRTGYIFDGWYADGVKWDFNMPVTRNMTLYARWNPVPLPELCMISVDMEYHNEIVWKRPNEVTAYNIYREGNTVGQYELIATIPYEEPNSWIDTESNAKIRSYTYLVSEIDTFGIESALSAPHKTMHLTINQGMGSWNLIWTPYEGTGYSTYIIYRAVGETYGELALISTIPSSLTSYTDFISTGSNYVYYLVEIVLDNVCEIGSATPSRSGLLKSGNSESSFGVIRSNIATNNPNGIPPDIPTGLEIRNVENIINVYPNPFAHEVHITGADGCMLRVINAAGLQVHIQMINNSDEIVRLGHLSAGVYFFHLEKDGQAKMVKAVKN